jgi:carboxyl-terminal processing protease
MKKILKKFSLLFVILSFIAFISSLTTNSYGAIDFNKNTKKSALECVIIFPIVQGFLNNHYQYKKLDSELESRTVKQFLNKLDPSKTFFLKSDIEELNQKLSGIFKKLGTQCTPLHEAQERLTQRVAETVAYAKKVLESKDFKFDDSVEIIVDPKKRDYAKNIDELNKNTYKLIQFQIANYLATDMKLEDAKKQLIHRYELNIKRQKEMSQDELYGMFLDSFASSLDAHSSFMGKETLEDFEISMRLSLEGIGAALSWEDGYTVIESLIPGGAAEKSGELQPKDKIIGVAQGDGPFENVIDMPLRDVVRLIRGKKDTYVRLSILRQDAKGTSHFIVKLKRSKINLQDEAAKLVYKTIKDKDKKYKVAIIDLPSFYGDMSKGTRSCFEDVKKLVEKANQDKADALILDLSKNGGGLLSEAVRIGGLFIREGNIVATQDSAGRIEKLADDDEKIYWNGPFAILTSRLSASASEIVAGAMKDYKRALIIGADHTFGKGTVQAMMNLPRDLGAIKVTTGMFFIPGGNSTQYKGVEADIVLPGVFSTKEIGEASLDYSLPPKSIPSFLSDSAGAAFKINPKEVGEMDLSNTLKNPGKLLSFASEKTKTGQQNLWKPVDDKIIKELQKKSKERVEKNPEFKKIKEELAELEANQGILKLSKALKKQKEENVKEKKSKSKKRKTDEEYLKQPEVQEATEVILDYIRLSA